MFRFYAPNDYAAKSKYETDAYNYQSLDQFPLLWRPGVLLSLPPLPEMRQAFSQQFTGTHLNSWVERYIMGLNKSHWPTQVSNPGISFSNRILHMYHSDNLQSTTVESVAIIIDFLFRFPDKTTCACFLQNPSIFIH